jgi:hypothetical protein
VTVYLFLSIAIWAAIVALVGLTVGVIILLERLSKLVDSVRQMAQVYFPAELNKEAESTAPRPGSTQVTINRDGDEAEDLRD